MLKETRRYRPWEGSLEPAEKKRDSPPLKKNKTTKYYCGNSHHFYVRRGSEGLKMGITKKTSEGRRDF